MVAIDSYWRNSEHKQFNIFRLSLSPVILSQPDRRRREGAVEGPRSDSDDHAASGSPHETLLNSFAPFAVKFQISLASTYFRPEIKQTPTKSFMERSRPRLRGWILKPRMQAQRFIVHSNSCVNIRPVSCSH